jgi:hypothetical protein
LGAIGLGGLNGFGAERGVGLGAIGLGGLSGFGTERGVAFAAGTTLTVGIGLTGAGGGAGMLGIAFGRAGTFLGTGTVAGEVAMVTGLGRAFGGKIA